MIHALTPFAIRGAIWYQGENNRPDGLAYEKKMEALIAGWRRSGSSATFPSITSSSRPTTTATTGRRRRATSPIRSAADLGSPDARPANSNTGMAVMTDIADLNDIHPGDKKDVGYRLSLWARARPTAKRPRLLGTAVKSMASGPNLTPRLRLRGRRAHPERRPAAELVRDRRRRPYLLQGRGRDRGEHGRRPEREGPAPKAVRFGWHQLAVPNLANKQGLPASPFRTDNW